MPEKVYLDDNGEPITGAPKVYLDDNGEPIKASAPSPTLKHAKSLAIGAARGVGDLISAEPLIAGAKAVPDIVSNIRSGALSAADTLKEFGRGALDAVQGLGDTFIRPVKGANRKPREDTSLITALDPGAGTEDPWERAAHRVVGVGSMFVAPELSKRAPKMIGGMRTAAAERAALKLTEAQGAHAVEGVTPKLVKAPVKPESASTVIVRELEGLRQPAPAPSVELPPPPFSLGEGAPPAQPRVSVAAPKTPKKVAGAKTHAQKQAATAPPSSPAPAAPELPASWKALAKPEAPPAIPEGVVGLSDDVPMWGKPSATPRDVSDLRGALGSKKAAPVLDMTQAETRAAAGGGPSRRPLAADTAELDNGYLRQLQNERGAVDPKLAIKLGLPIAGAAAGGAYFDENPVGGAVAGGLAGAALANPVAAVKRANELRQIAMLSGGALPKSILGNVGAHVTAAAEQGSMAPIKEMLRLPTNLKNAAAGFRAQTAPGGSMTSGAKVQGLGRVNIPGRLMGALDDASQASLQRAGVPKLRAKQLQLMEENPVGPGSSLNTALNTRVGQFAVPFQRVPINQWSQGVQSLEGLLPAGKRPPSIHNSLRGRALTAGTMAGGAVAGDQTQNPLALAMIAALAGPRALPFALGAGGAVAAKGGRAKSVLERVGVGLPEGSVSDLIDPTRAIDKPALIRFLEQLRGEK